MRSISDYLDEQLGRITMYRLLVFALIAIVVNALLLMVVGYLAYSPIAFVMSSVLLVGVAYGSNRLLGWLFGVTPHGESAIITGLILALLFSPPTSVLAVIKLVLIAVIAMASKYIIVIRNRHIFNPAAIAIVIASVTKLAFATWWIATPALLPVTLVAAGLVLFKTRQLQTAGVFLAVAIAGIVLQTVISGNGSSETIMTALISWPLVFFAGIMLCEPLTLPPKRSQRFIVAGLVGVVLVSSFHWGPISMTPALALVVGNAVAWTWTTRRAIKLRFMGKRHLGSTIYDFAFDTNKLAFEPGQYLELTLPHHHADSRGMRRMFSIVGHSGDEQLSIGTRIPEKPSTFKRALMALRNGQVVYATRVAGDFVLPKDTSVPIVLIAGGIGITPYISHIMAAGKRKITLVYIVNSVDDLVYVRELARYDVDVTVVSPDDARLPDGQWHHVKAARLSPDLLRDIIGESKPLVFVSGPPAMVNATKHIAKGLGLRVKTDHFAGY